MTFKELSEWYLDLTEVKNLASYPTLQTNFKNLNRTLGNKIVKDVMPSDLEEYKVIRRNDDDILTGIDQFENYVESVDQTVDQAEKKG